MFRVLFIFRIFNGISYFYTLCLVLFNFIKVLFLINYFRICVSHLVMSCLKVVLYYVASYLIAFHILNILYLIMILHLNIVSFKLLIVVFMFK